MDNVVWLIIASAVTIALGGILLFAGNGTLADVTDRATEILNINASDTQVGEDENTPGPSEPDGPTDGNPSDGTEPPAPPMPDPTGS